LSTLTPILQVNNLETVFSTAQGSTKAVDKVSFEVYPGEVVAIVGESGSGKSATALSVMRLLSTPPAQITGGEVRFQSDRFGQLDLLQASERQLQQIRGCEISMIFQDPMSSLNPVLCCGKQVAEALLLHTKLTKKEAKARVLQLFADVGLPRPESIYKAYPHSLSGGQQQRVMIAMAMACKPALLLADEPTTALDVTVQAQTLALIDQLRLQAQTAVLFITHDLGVVADMADRILVMCRGKVVETGTVHEVFTHPQHPYTRGLLACRPTLTGRPQALLPTMADFMQPEASGTAVKKQQELHTADLLPNGGCNSLRKKVNTREKELQQPLLEVENLQVHFAAGRDFWGRTRAYVKAVDRVSFAIYPGETVALVGESGCGKTTLGRAVLRLLEPTGGRILFQGHDLAQLDEEALRRRRRYLQMIFQDPYASLNPMHTVGEAIIEPMRVHKLYARESERRGKAMELLEKVGLSDEHFDAYPQHFSGGQQQRICIARALALQPDLLVADEAVSSLDVSVQAQVLNLLNQLKQESGMSYLFITHNLAVARHMADRILVMHEGRIVESGTPEQVYLNPQQAYTRTLLSAVPGGGIKDMMAARQRREILQTVVPATSLPA